MAETDKDEPQKFPNFPLNITIKQEKQSPKRKSDTSDGLVANGECSNGIFAANHEDSKGSLSLDPPLKSSDEILAELFGVFNAAPPETLLGDKKHSKKKSKKEKKHKKIKEEPTSGNEESEDDSSDSDTSDDFGVSGDLSKPKKSKKKKKKKSREGSVDSKGEKKKKHKKHKKHKIKKEKHSDGEAEEGEILVKKEKSEERKRPTDEREKSGKEDLRDLLRNRKRDSRDKSREHDHARKDVKEKPKIQIKSLVNSTILRDAIKAADNRHKSRDRDRKRKKSESDISLSDEEEGRTSSKRYRNPFSHAVKSENPRSNRFYDGYYESYRHGRRRSRSRSYERSRRRRSRSRSGNRLDIDKKQLLEIARKNAIQMLKNGTLPGVQSLAQETKDKLMVKVKYGGKTVAELTDYCKKLSNGEIGDSDISDVDSEVEERAFHHPFELKDREPIIMNIRNSVPIQPKSASEKKELLKLFPVSSGQDHRKTELEWVPVEPPAPVAAPNETNAPIPAIMPAPTAAPIVPLQNPQPQAPPKTTEPLPVPPVAEVAPLAPPPPPPVLPNESDLAIANSWKSSDFGLATTPSQGVFNQTTQVRF